MVKVHYNEATRKVEGFYPDFVEYAAIPEPYVEVTDERHAELVTMANSGKELYLSNLVEKSFDLREIVISQEQQRQNRIAELKSLLAQTDYQAIKYAEGQLSASEYAEMKKQRQTWRDEINLLEEDGVKHLYGIKTET